MTSLLAPPTSARGEVRARSLVAQLLVVSALLGLLALAAGALGGEPATREVTTMLIYITVVAGLFIFTGLSGVVSFGHIGFMAIGAYAGALVTIPTLQKGVLLPDLPGFLADMQVGFVAGALISGVVAALFAAIASVPIMRLSGLSASLATLALLVIVQVVASNWEQVTRGSQTMLGVPTNTTVAKAFAVATLAIAVAIVFQRSRVGRRLRAHREDELAARASGIGGGVELRVAFTTSAFVVGVAGFTMAQFLGAFNPDVFYLDLTFLTLAMLVVGGMYSLWGAVAGAVLVSAIDWALRAFEQNDQLGFITLPGRPGIREAGIAVAMLVVLIAQPEGLFPALERASRRLKRKRQP